MKIMLATLCLNEMEWLQKLYDQHKDWPDLVSWVFVESADRVYANVNPTLVSKEGLSIDGTSDFLRDLARSDSRVQYIPHGFSTHVDPALGKTESRQRYLATAEDVRPDFFVVLDADEFYCQKDQFLINGIMQNEPVVVHDYSFQFTHVWHPQSIVDEPLFKLEVKGGFWKMRHAKGFRWHPGIHYGSNHQRPTWNKGDGRIKFYNSPSCVHMAFASDPVLRKSKHDYYIARGEGADEKRYWYVQSRRSFETWKPGDRLMRGARVVPYQGFIPEVFQASCVSV
jgi:hypothetical protein